MVPKLKTNELNYNYHRNYDPHLGRYVQPDPIGLDGGLNPYVYANGNPLRYVDPLGLDPVPPEPPGPTPAVKLDSAIKRGDIKTLETLMEVLSPAEQSGRFGTEVQQGKGSAGRNG